MHISPYESKNIIFIDTEFTSLDPSIGEILSIGIVKPTGESLYIELAHDGPVDPWVWRHILPMLTAPKVSKEEAKQQIKKFLGRKHPFAVAYVDNYDSLYFVKLFGVGKLPFRWMTIDFSSILFAHGIDPTKMLATESDAKQLYRSLGIDLTKYTAHHALDDARLLKDAWMALLQDTNIAK
jgi:DNA polymerase III epsilon subunit-like protein